MSKIPEIYCAKCRVKMKLIETGVKIYDYRIGDLYECPKCGIRVIHGLGWRQSH